MDGTEDLQVVDDTLWGQVVPQCGLHHCGGHVLSTNRWDISDLLGLRVPQPQLQLDSRDCRVILRSAEILTNVPMSPAGDFHVRHWSLPLSSFYPTQQKETSLLITYIAPYVLG